MTRDREFGSCCSLLLVFASRLVETAHGSTERQIACQSPRPKVYGPLMCRCKCCQCRWLSDDHRRVNSHDSMHARECLQRWCVSTTLAGRYGTSPSWGVEQPLEARRIVYAEGTRMPKREPRTSVRRRELAERRRQRFASRITATCRDPQTQADCRRAAAVCRLVREGVIASAPAERARASWL